MCGIWAYIAKTNHSIKDTTNLKNYNTFHDIPRIRGPDSTNEIFSDSYHLVFHRLAINDLSDEGNQPFVFSDNANYTYYILCNGEIYNYKKIIEQFNIKTKSKSDCEVLCYLFENYWNTPLAIAHILDGEFAIVALRVHPNGERSVIVIRDPFGVRPLYWGQVPSAGALLFSSMLGGICNLDGALCDHFPPGHYMKVDMNMYSNTTAVPVLYYNIKHDIMRHTYHIHDVNDEIPEHYYKNITTTLIDAVKTRLDSTDREVGFFLSGGLDSSLIVGIAVKILNLKRPRTFSIGMIDSPDLKYAREVADFLDTDHTEVYFTASEAVDAIPEVISCLETYDITTIRASIPSYLLAKYIRKYTNIKVIMNGDGSDEVACGYLYNYNAPNAQAAHEDALRLLKEIHKFDGLRCDRTIAGNGIEARVPFLDPEYVSYYLSIPSSLRIPTHINMEKLMLRNAFNLYSDDSNNLVNVLPKSVLFRRKEAFSNGVSGVSTTNDHKETMIECIQKWAKTHNSSESEMYKKIFNSLFPDHSHILPHYWMPKWSGETNDPSATTLNIYKKLNNDK